jgi:hypothetical protein
MLVGRYSKGLSDDELQRKSKKSQALSEAPRRPVAYRDFIARSRRTSAMFVGRCSSELFGHEPREAALAHSVLNAFIGSMEAARSSGISAANSPATARITATNPKSPTSCEK